ncbi:MAG: hypothetical protein ABFD13_04710, partial [Candidatus Cryosericum sp.]
DGSEALQHLTHMRITVQNSNQQKHRHLRKPCIFAISLAEDRPLSTAALKTRPVRPRLLCSIQTVPGNALT